MCMCCLVLTLLHPWTAGWLNPPLLIIQQTPIHSSYPSSQLCACVSGTHSVTSLGSRSSNPTLSTSLSKGRHLCIRPTCLANYLALNHTHTHTHTHIHTHTRTHTHAHMHSHTHTHAYTHMHEQACACTRMHAHTHTHTHTHTAHSHIYAIMHIVTASFLLTADKTAP